MDNTLHRQRSLQKNRKFLSTLIKTLQFQPLKCRFSLWNSSPKKPKTRQSLRHFEQYSVASPGDFVQMAFDKSFNYHSGLWLLLHWAILFLAKHAPNSENDNLKDTEVDNCLEKINFADLVKGTKSLTGFFSFQPTSSGTEWRHINTT